MRLPRQAERAGKARSIAAGCQDAAERPPGREIFFSRYELNASYTGWSGEEFCVFPGGTARKRHYVQRTARRHIVLNAISYRIVYCISYRIIVLYIHTK